MIAAPRATGAATRTATGNSIPALSNSATAAAIITAPRAVRNTALGSFTLRWLPIHTPGSEPIRIAATRPKSTLHAATCAIAAAHSRIAAWKTSVPTTVRGTSR